MPSTVEHRRFIGNVLREVPFNQAVNEFKRDENTTPNRNRNRPWASFRAQGSVPGFAFDTPAGNRDALSQNKLEGIAANVGKTGMSGVVPPKNDSNRILRCGVKPMRVSCAFKKSGATNRAKRSECGVFRRFFGRHPHPRLILASPLLVANDRQGARAQPKKWPFIPRNSSNQPQVCCHERPSPDGHAPFAGEAFLRGRFRRRQPANFLKDVRWPVFLRNEQ
jgi:hypothetical protein